MAVQVPVPVSVQVHSIVSQAETPNNNELYEDI